MQIIVGKHSGFCFGVKRAVDMVEAELLKGGAVYTLGEIIHNPQVVEDLAARGARPVADVSCLSAGDTLVIRSHGVGEEIYKLLHEKNVHLIDATCPFVAKIQRIVKNAYGEGKRIFIIG